MSEWHEGDYALIDVRELDEYLQSHIPGAQNVPLTQMMDGSRKPPSAPRTVFYCLGGKRSDRAAQLAVEKLGIDNVYTLTGGISAWNGHALPNPPNLRAFGSVETLPDVVRVAIALEKGAERFYKMLADRLQSSQLRAIVSKLAEAEVGHARELHKQLLVHQPDAGTFEDVYGAASDNILESGDSFIELSALAERRQANAGAAVMQLAFEMELRAYDLYRYAASIATTDTLRSLFTGLAEQEKGHARSVSKALAFLTGSLGR